MTAHKESSGQTFSERTTRCRIRSTLRTHCYRISFGRNITAITRCLCLAVSMIAVLYTKDHQQNLQSTRLAPTPVVPCPADTSRIVRAWDEARRNRGSEQTSAACLLLGHAKCGGLISVMPAQLVSCSLGKRASRIFKQQSGAILPDARFL